MSRRLASFFCLILALPACSLYQSDGRKYLEKQGLTFTSNSLSVSEWSFPALQVEDPCAELYEKPSLSREEWSLLEKSDDGLSIYQTETESAYDILVYMEKSQRHFVCAFYYDDIHHRLMQIETDLNLAYQIVQHLESF